MITVFCTAFLSGFCGIEESLICGLIDGVWPRNKVSEEEILGINGINDVLKIAASDAEILTSGVCLSDPVGTLLKGSCDEKLSMVGNVVSGVPADNERTGGETFDDVVVGNENSAGDANSFVNGEDI